MLTVSVIQSSVPCEDFLVRECFISEPMILDLLKPFSASFQQPDLIFMDSVRMCLGALVYDLSPRLVCKSVLRVISRGSIFSRAAIFRINIVFYAIVNETSIPIYVDSAVVQLPFDVITHISSFLNIVDIHKKYTISICGYVYG